MVREAIAKAIKTFGDLGTCLNLYRTEDENFFPKWYDRLPELNDPDKDRCDRL